MIPAVRLRNQHITKSFPGTVAELLASFGAMQSQEYPYAKWALALRLRDETTSAMIDEAFARGLILRTHVMRPTWHFVTARDISWLLALTSPRVRAATASYFPRNGLDARTLTRTADLIAAALRGGRYLTRRELAAALRRRRIGLTPLQMGLVMFHAELEAVVCSGPRRGTQFTYALLDERVAQASATRLSLDGDEARAELATRFLRHHGPATVRDFVWWSGLKTTDARRGIELARAHRLEADGLQYWYLGELTYERAPRTRVDLLPVYDEYLVAYRDRLAVPYGPGSVRTTGGGTPFRHAVVIDGQVAGTWRIERKQSASVLTVTPLRRLRPVEKLGVEEQAACYERFAGEPVSLAMSV